MIRNFLWDIQSILLTVVFVVVGTWLVDGLFYLYSNHSLIVDWTPEKAAVSFALALGSIAGAGIMSMIRSYL